MSGKDRFYDLVKRGREGKNVGLSIGLPKMETYMDGYLPGTSYLIAAQSGVGKSTFMLYSFIYKPLMEYLSDPTSTRDPYWIMFNLEMTQEQIYAKLLSMYIYEKHREQITYKEMFSRGKNSHLSDDHLELLEDCGEFLDILDERLILHEGTFNSDKYQEKVTEDLKRFGTFKGNTYIPNNPNQIIGCVVDHLSLTRASSGRSKKEEMDLVSSYSVQYRNRCQIFSPIHIMQFNRSANGQERLKQGLQDPDASDFKDSAAMYEDSHVVMALHSPIKFKLSTYRHYNIQVLGQNFVSCHLLKSRFGTSDIADGLGFYGDCSTYIELPKAEEITGDWERYKDPMWVDSKVMREDNKSNHMTLTL